MGLDHVRLSVNPKAMWQHNDADEIPAEYLTYLDKAVKMILEEDLAVVIDIHSDGDFKEKLTNDALPRWRRGGVECAPGVQREFGVYRNVAKAEDRARWLSGVRTSLKKDGIGRTMWDYSGGFGLVAKVNGQTSVDEMTMTALGLKVVGTN
jgi:hypothetical protein